MSKTEANPEPITPAKSGSGKIYMWAIIGGLLLGIIIWISGTISGSPSDEPYDPNWSGEATAQCEDLVTQNLKAPSTAKFDTDAEGDGTWIVTGTVDSENSFEATLRADFQCTVIMEGESIKRRLDYLN